MLVGVQQLNALVVICVVSRSTLLLIDEAYYLKISCPNWVFIQDSDKSGWWSPCQKILKYEAVVYENRTNIMANSEHQNGNGKSERETIEVSFPRSELRELEKCAENKGLSPEKIIRESVKNTIHKGKVREILAKECQENGKLDPESRTCKLVQKDHDFE